MGSGHILVYAFDVLMQIYLSCGYTERDAAQSIVRRNLWGLDLDKRAYQLAYFAVMMKARQYDRRFLTRKIKPNLSHFQDLPTPKYELLDEPIKSFVKQFENADTYGSLITAQADDSIDEALDEFQNTLDLNFDHMEHLMQLYKILSQRYDVVCTNPPYMGGSGMNEVLSGYVKKNFADSKSDLFACFIERCGMFAKEHGCYAMITQHAWMFLSSYEKLREKLSTRNFVNMAHLGARAFDEIGGEVVQTTAFVHENNHINNYSGTYARLVDIVGENEKRDLFLSGENRYTAKQESFSKIPGSPVAYWVSENFIRAFEGEKLGDYGKTCQGLATGNNDKFLRLWHECDFTTIFWSCKSHEESYRELFRWYPCTKGGSFRRWYGNLEYVVNWYKDGYEIKKFSGSVIRNANFYFKKAYTWSTISSGKFSMRYAPVGSIFESKGSKCFVDYKDFNYILGLLNTCVTQEMLAFLAPTLDYHEGPVSRIPIKFPYLNSDFEKVHHIVEENISISKADWDVFEKSWDFKKHPFIRPVKRIKEAYEQWAQECEKRFRKLKANEEELNRIFIDIYGLGGELTSDVEERDVTVRRADIERDCKSFISYAVGCMFGRYSLDREGLVFAGGNFDRVYWKHKGHAPLDEKGETPLGGGYAGISMAAYNYPRFWNEDQDWENTPYLKFSPDADNCIPITDDSFFEDDIVGQFVRFVSAAFDEECLEENLRFIADNIGIKGNGTAREKLRQYFIKDFFKDHCKVYQKRPIYWLFDTGKKNGFKALVYMHRWTVNTVGNVRIDYMHKLQRLYRNEIIRLKENIDADEETAKSRKRLEKITNQLKETEEYDAKIGIVVAARTGIDLDDGVKVNYDKVQVGSDGKHYQILAKI